MTDAQKLAFVRSFLESLGVFDEKDRADIIGGILYAIALNLRDTESLDSMINYYTAAVRAAWETPRT